MWRNSGKVDWVRFFVSCVMEACAFVIKAEDNVTEALVFVSQALAFVAEAEDYVPEAEVNVSQALVFVPQAEDFVPEALDYHPEEGQTVR